MLKFKIWISLLIISGTICAQEAKELNYGKVHYPIKTSYPHSGFWVTNPDIDVKQYNVVLFRKKFNLDKVPDSLIVHISADNLYRLYINGKFVCLGPARNDLVHWNYETIDVAPFLIKGENLVAIQVNNFGHNKAKAQFSFQTGFFINTDNPEFEIINSDDKSWKTTVNKAYREKPVEWMYQKDIVNGWYCLNPTDSIIASNFPWGWQLPGFDDSSWKVPVWLASLAIRNTEQHGPILLQPRSVQLLEHHIERLNSVLRSRNITILGMPFNGKDSLVIPANSDVEILMDNKVETMGFPVLLLSDGKGSKIKLTYSECLFDKNLQKGNRNEIENKKIIGLNDILIPDGGTKRAFQALWYRAFRFIQLNIKTGNQPLVINDFFNEFTAYPFKEKAIFQTDDSIYNAIWKAGMRTDLICSQDFYMSDAYYETMQYLGDTRVHGIVTAVTTGDYSLYRQAILQFDQSRIPEGLTLAAYPNDWYWVLPYYSLMWVDIVYDYTMLTGDKELARQMLPGVRSVLDWYNRHLDKNNMLGTLEWANPNGADKYSTLFSLYYAYSLKNTSSVLDYLEKPEEASLLRNRSDLIAASVFKNSWDEKKSMLAETPDKKSFNQWGNIMGVLTDAIPQEMQKELMQRICSDSSIGHVGYFESFYLFQALNKTGSGNVFDQELKPWKDQINEGLTTFKEIPSDRARSDCHPWSTCPLYYFFRTICGIEAVKPGFSEVRIAPQPGKLKHIKAMMPTINGNIYLEISATGKTGIKSTITLPDGVKGMFIWNNKEIPIREGTQNIALP